jgi:hypothetical protein
MRGRPGSREEHHNVEELWRQLGFVDDVQFMGETCGGACRRWGGEEMQRPAVERSSSGGSRWWHPAVIGGKNAGMTFQGLLAVRAG